MAPTNMIAQIWAARILAKLEKTLVFAQPGVVNRDYEGDIREFGDRVHVHSFGDLTIGDYTRNSTLIIYEELTDSRVTLLIDRSKFFAFKVDDVDAAQMKPKIIDEASERASYQLRDVADQYVAGLYAGATNTVTASQWTAANAYQKLVELIAEMDELNLPEEGRYVVVPPWVKGLLLQNAAFLSATESGNANRAPAVLNGQVGQVGGLTVLVSNNVPTTGTAPIVSHMLAGHSSGIGYAEQIVNVEAIRLQTSFADGIRGLHLYGAKVLDAARIFDVRANA